MIYTTAVLPAEVLANEKRQLRFDSEFDRMARDRGRAERERLLALPGAIAPPPGEREYGDVILVMVDAGSGEDAAAAVAKAMEA